MANTIQQNLTPSEPSLADLLTALKKDIFLSLNSHHIGTIQSFDTSTQTASATINYKKTFFNYDATNGTYTSSLEDYPTLSDCPVICLGGGKSSLTFPISKGDECLCLFNDRDMDNWFGGASNAPTGTPRLHSFSDAILIVGLRSLNHSLASYDSTRAVLKNDKAMVGVGPELIKIANDMQSLKTLFEGLAAKVDSVLSTGMVASAPGPVTFIGTVASFNSTVEELLE